MNHLSELFFRKKTDNTILPHLVVFNTQYKNKERLGNSFFQLHSEEKKYVCFI